MAEFVYGIRKIDEKIISIYDIPNDQVGLKCACKCPTCRMDFEACSLQGKVNRYFRHYSDKSSGVGGGGGCDAYSTNESALHLMAKEIIKEEGSLFFPSQTIPWQIIKFPNLPSYLKEQITQEYVLQKAEQLECLSVKLEKPLQGFQPDVSVVTSRGEILIEIVVTNDIKSEKKERIKEYNVPTLKIDLSEFVEKPISRSQLREIIVGETDLKSWVYFPMSAEDFKSAQEFYENDSVILQYFKNEEKEKEKAQLEKAKRERGEKKFQVLLETQNYNIELERLRNDEEFLSYARKHFIFYKVHQKKPFFIDIPITGEMIFQCDRRIWQGQIFDRYIYKRKEDEATFNMMAIFDNLKNDHHIPVDDDLICVTDVQGCFWLYEEVIKTYIEYLELLGFVASKGFGSRKWKVVKVRRSIEAPNKIAAETLFNALKKVNRRAPNIDMLLSYELREFYNERRRQAEIERKKAEKIKQEAKEAEAKKQSEVIAKRLAKKREQIQQKILDFDFEQSVVMIRDEEGWRLAKCTSCNKIYRASQVKIVPPNLNKGICRDCLRKQKNGAGS